MQKRQWQWIEPTQPKEWELAGGPLPAELLQILQTRGIKDEKTAQSYLLPEFYTPALPSELPELDRAVEILNTLIDQGNPNILLWGDFDLDGQTSTAILLEGLQNLGATVTYTIPDRQRESHGLHLKSLKSKLDAQLPDLLLVCDTGSSNVDAVEYAKSCGVPVIIADHHELPPTLPPADALINPQKLTHPKHPLKTLSGVGVSYLLLQALYESRGRGHEVRRFLDLVAMGLMADVVELVNDTRYLVQLGLKALRKTDRPGLIAIANQLQLNLSNLTETDISFKLAPILNALGRLNTAAKGVELLTTRDPVYAQLLAQEADGLNRQRQNLTEQMQASAEEQIQRDPTLLDWEALVLSSPNWHSGIVGIVAARLSEIYHKPVAMLVTDESGAARGSIRSVAGYHVSQALSQIADILGNYGGHEGAGGFSISAENLPLLRRRLSQAFANSHQDLPTPTLTIDAILPLERLTLDFAYQLQRLAPFGSGNPIPLFATPNLKLLSVAKIGHKGQHRRLTVQNQEGQRQTVFWWGNAKEAPPEGTFHLAYTLSVSIYQDAPSLQLTLQDWQQIEAPALDPIKSAEILDYRNKSPHTALDEIAQIESDSVIWAEGYPASRSPGLSLSRLTPAPALIVLTSPSSHKSLLEAIKTVQPQRIYLIATASLISALSSLQQELNGLLNTVIEHQDGLTSLEQLAERLAITEQIAELALKLTTSQRQWHLSIGGRGKVTLSPQTPSTLSPQEAEQIERKLKHAWQERNAYHSYLQRVEIEHLLG